MRPPMRYMHHGDMHTGVPITQHGYGVLKVPPYQKGYGYYNPKTRIRRQRGKGLGALFALGRRLLPKIIPMATRLGKAAARESIKSIPRLVQSKNRKAVVKSIAKNLGKTAVDTLCQQRGSGVRSRMYKHGKRRRRGHTVQRRRR